MAYCHDFPFLHIVQIWHENMPYNKLADRKGHQGWMKKEGPYFIFPGGGTMFPDGAVQYIEKLKQYIPIAGGVLRTALDMGCGVRTSMKLFFSSFTDSLKILNCITQYLFRLPVLEATS